MNSYDAEMHILRQKEMARRVAEQYPLISYRNRRRRPVHRRALAGLGGVLVTFGYRLQGEIEQLSAATDLMDPPRFSSNGHGAEW